MPIRSGSISSDAIDSFEGEITGVAGSYGYMAPEVFRGQPYNQKADIFSFGVLMYNLCYRIVPSLMIMSNGDRQDMVVFAKKVSQGFRQPLNDEKVPPSINALIASCWQESPEARPSASAIVKKLNEILETGMNVIVLLLCIASIYLYIYIYI
jgi:serine/threonine protein kinase